MNNKKTNIIPVKKFQKYSAKHATKITKEDKKALKQVICWALLMFVIPIMMGIALLH